MKPPIHTDMKVNSMKIKLTALSTSEKTMIYEMIKEIGPGENGFVNSLNAGNEEAFHTEI